MHVNLFLLLQVGLQAIFFGPDSTQSEYSIAQNQNAEPGLAQKLLWGSAKTGLGSVWLGKTQRSLDWPVKLFLYRTPCSLQGHDKGNK